MLSIPAVGEEKAEWTSGLTLPDDAGCVSNNA